MYLVHPFSLNHLDETEFENFCYDLLKELGFVNINWRKGTGLPSSPSDGGRDIECQLLREEIDGSKYLEYWFIECKHYQKGVPPEKIQATLSWANAGRPDKLLIITSNFLSNRAKDYLSDYIKNNRPHFKILYWEQPDLGTLSANKPSLLNKYKIARNPYLYSILHPIHMQYLRSTDFNSIGYLLNCLDHLDYYKRDLILAPVYIAIINPSSPNKIYKGAYEAFKKKCHEIIALKVIDERVLTNAIVSITLQHCFSKCGSVAVEEMIDVVQTFARVLQKELEAKGEDFSKVTEQLGEDAQRKVKESIALNYDIYKYFCENILAILLLEQYLNTGKLYLDE